MNRFRTRISNLLFGLAALLIGTQSVHAHPHGWIEIKTKLIFDDNGDITAMHHEWIQDEFTSAFNVEGTDKDGNGEPDDAELEKLKFEFMENLVHENFFAKFKSGYIEPRLGKAVPHSLTMEGLKLNLKFTTPFQTPVSTRTNPFQYAFFDPSFYIEMLHVEGDGPITLVNKPDNCSWELVPPNPDPNIAAYALSLDQGASGGNSLGEHFAEWATITCK